MAQSIGASVCGVRKPCVRAAAPFPAYAGTTTQGRWLPHSIPLFRQPLILPLHFAPARRSEAAHAVGLKPPALPREGRRRGLDAPA
jgi:hypothetical protein